MPTTAKSSPKKTTTSSKKTDTNSSKKSSSTKTNSNKSTTLKNSSSAKKTTSTPKKVSTSNPQKTTSTKTNSAKKTVSNSTKSSTTNTKKNDSAKKPLENDPASKAVKKSENNNSPLVLESKKKKKSRKKLWFIIGGIILLILLIIFSGFAIYVNIYNHADDYAYSYLESSQKVSVYEDDNTIKFEPQKYNTGFIFYPGGKVEAKAYAPLMHKLAENDILGIIVKMPFNLAVFNVNGADGLKDEFAALDNWYIGGHSLGGAMAASYVANHQNDFQGLILLGAYSTENISNSNLNVLTIYGENDGVLDRGKYESCLSNLPNNYLEFVIEGGCHSYFGSYGLQSGDGIPLITKEEQLNITVDFITDNISKNVYRKFNETTESFNNPDNGFYEPMGIRCEPDKVQAISANYLKYNALLHLRIDISAFSGKVNNVGDKELTQTMLDGLANEFQRMEDAGTLAIIRFAYDPHFGGSKDMEPSLDMIVKHIKALEPLFKKYESTISAIECGLIGPWGEMHSSAIAKQETYNVLIDTYLACTSPKTKILLRRPAFIYNYYGYTLQTLNSFNVTDNRLGCYNDGYLGSGNDLGTYVNREIETAWLGKLNENLPYGGEVTIPGSEYNRLNNACAEMFLLHLSYLNERWNNEVVARWKNTIYTGEDPLYHNLSEYQYIKNHLGYRFVLNTLRYSLTSKLDFTLDIKNVGFGNLYRSKNVYIIIKNEVNEYLFELGEFSLLNLNYQIDLSNVALGEYQVYYVIADDIKDGMPFHSIRLASDGIWSNEAKANLIINNLSIK